MKNKKILIINEFYHPFIGGMEYRFKRISERFIENGHSVDIMCIAHEANLPKEEFINGVKVNRLLENESYYKKGFFGRTPFTMFKFYFEIKKALKNKSFDVVIIGQFALVPLFFSKKLFNNNSITFIDFVEYRHSFLWKIINSIILNKTDKVSCISNNVQRVVLSKHRNLNANNVISIPNSLDMSDFSSVSDDYFIFVGRLVPHKNPDKAIKAVLKYNEIHLNKSYPIHIVGDGEMYDVLKENYKNNKEVVFHGFVSEEEKQNILSRARLLIFPSDREGLPGVFIESLGSTIPILTTNGVNNNSKEFVIEEKVGEVTSQNINDIVNGIFKIESNREYYINNIKSVRSNYDLDHTITKFIN